MGPTKTFHKLRPPPKPDQLVPDFTTIVRNGVRQAPKPVLEKVERRWFSQEIALKLEEALIDRVAEEESLYDSGAFPDGLADIVFEFHRSVCKVIDRTLDHASPGAPPTLRDAKGLSVVVAQFKTDLSQFPGFDISSDTLLAICIQTLCDDVEHYIQQIRIVYSIVGLRAKHPIPANRPTNWDGKALFVKSVLEYQERKGLDSFPSLRIVMGVLRLDGHSVPERTLRSWRRQFKEGTLGFHVQRHNRQ